MDGAETVLVEIETDAGVTGIGESLGATDAATVAAALQRVTPDLIGHLAFDIARLVERLHRRHFGGFGPANQRRFSNQILAGVELALWDALGKQANCQCLVSLTLARNDVFVPIGLRLYLPKVWTNDPARSERAMRSAQFDRSDSV